MNRAYDCGQYLVKTIALLFLVQIVLVCACERKMSTEKTATKKIKKMKPQQQRLYDSNGYRLRVDCVCFNDWTKEEVIK